jgi:DNA-binding CsgD family transcriptional regulator
VAVLGLDALASAAYGPGRGSSGVSAEIARALCLSSKTVDAHRLHINRKLGVSGPAELARLLAGEGILAG